MSLVYNQGDIKEGQFRISPSQLNKFFSDSGSWYKENVLNQNRFEGNTSSVIGSLLHHRIEEYYKGNFINLDTLTEEEFEYLARYKDNPVVDGWVVPEDFIAMWKVWLDSEWSMLEPIVVEPFISKQVTDEYIIGGSVDMVYKLPNGKVVLVDWKTTAKKPSSVTQYLMQNKAYCWIYEQLGKKIDYYSWVYITRPTRSAAKGKEGQIISEPKIWDGYYTGNEKKGYELKDKFMYPYTEDDSAYIEKQLKIITKCMTLAKKDESMIDILFRDNPSSRW